MACQIIARSIIFFKVILQETFKFNKPENPFQNYDVAKKIQRSPNWQRIIKR